MPTNEIGPANAVTHAERILESRISAMRNTLMLTPMLCAYASPSWYAPIGFAIRNVMTKVMPITAAEIATLLQLMPEKLPCDQPWRLTISESSAKVTTKSVTAEQM